MTNKIANRAAQVGCKIRRLEESPLFGLRSKKRLAHLLYREPQEISKLLKSSADELYRIGPVTSKGKVRVAQVPRLPLKRVHKRIFCIINQIRRPDYVHSGTLRRSYITNASKHIGAKSIFKTDIKKFFPSVLWGDVFRFFRRGMECSPDVSAVLAYLCTVENTEMPGERDRRHIPTGSCISEILAYWAFHGMFDTIHAAVSKRGLSMTLYVDDLVVSGTAIPLSLRREIVTTIGSSGLHAHKTRYFNHPNQVALITGVVVTESGIRLPNQRRNLIREGLKSLHKKTSNRRRISRLKKLIGQCIEASQFDSRYRSISLQLSSHLKNLKSRMAYGVVRDRSRR